MQPVAWYVEGICEVPPLVRRNCQVKTTTAPTPSGESEKGARINGNTAVPHLEVEVWACGVAAGADLADDLAAGHGRAVGHNHAIEVAVERHPTAAMGDDDVETEARRLCDDVGDAGCGGAYRGAACRRDVDAGVHVVRRTGRRVGLEGEGRAAESLRDLSRQPRAG